MLIDNDLNSIKELPELKAPSVPRKFWTIDSPAEANPGKRLDRLELPLQAADVPVPGKAIRKLSKTTMWSLK